MKKMVLLLGVVLVLSSCRKMISNNPADHVRTILSAQLSEPDLLSVNWQSLQSAPLSNHHRLYLLQMGKENIVLETNEQDDFVKGAIYQTAGKVSKVNGKGVFNGSFQWSDLQRNNHLQYSIEDGVVSQLHTFKEVGANGIGQRITMKECTDCTLPEVIVGASYPSGGGISYGAWLSLLSMFNMGGPADYILIDWSSGGGGGGVNSAPVITIDLEAPENKTKIEPKKYTDCFGSIPDNSTTLYTVTISTDLPSDGHPEIFYNWHDMSPGHAFVELNKSTPYGGVAQSFGFYPTSSYKLLPLDNSTSLAAKVVDDGGHEYQARYTISVTASQFQAAVYAVNNARDLYNVGLYNCTDFALDVFNAAGGNLTIPKHAIPGFEVDGGSNTPQGLYEKIQSLKNSGTTGTTTTNSKEYGGSSKGPCN